MTSSGSKKIAMLVVGCVVLGIGWIVIDRLNTSRGSFGKQRRDAAIPVEVAEITTGSITHKRTFSGTLEAQAQFLVAPKVSGRVERLYVDISDTVSLGQVVAELDNAEYIQELAQAKADLEVAKANLIEAQNALIIANRELDRVTTLKNRGVKSESQFDVAKTTQLEKQAKLEVAKAQVIKAEATLETANIRLGYTKVTAEWTGEDTNRVVAERFVDEGDTVSANTSLMSIVRLDPILGVIFITEKDYTRLSVGQTVTLSTDAFAQQQFHGEIARIAPIFKAETRQARIEIRINNPDHLLKPGMFIRAIVELGHLTDAVIIPEQAVTKRNDQTGIFMVMEKDNTVAWHPVKVGIKEDDRVSVEGIDKQGKVVILGQQLLNDGSKIVIPKDKKPSDLSSDQKAAPK